MKQIRYAARWEDRQVGRYAWVLGGFWTLVVLASVLWNLNEEQVKTLAIARAQANAYLDKDEAFRLWGAGHGGVYVPVSDRSPPNEHLDHLPERDVMTPSGRSLTLVNPAYMMRQLNEQYTRLFGVQGRITSLKPLRPENSPDPWEAQALRAFETGMNEVSEVVPVDGAPILRLMRPFVTEQPCLKCHEHQGYKEGDIRGGISIRVPMGPLLALERRGQGNIVLWHGLLWLLGLSGIVWATRRTAGILEDRRAAQAALTEQHRTLETILDHAPIGIWFQEPSGRLRFVNKPFCDAVGVSEERFLSVAHYGELYDETTARSCMASDAEALAQAEPHVSEERVQFTDGRRHQLEIIKVRVTDADGQPSGLIGLSVDVTESREAQARIVHLAYHDVLTGLPNRRLVVDRLHQELVRARRHGHYGALLFLDLDQFKTINDSLGHPIGDGLLRELSSRLVRDLRGEDTVARLGGDEFLVLLSEVSDDAERAAEVAGLRAQELLERVALPCCVEGHDLHITASIGIALFPVGDDSADDLLKHADTAMYRAKDSGRNTLQFFLPGMQQAAESRLRMQTDLRRALERDELDLAFQPLVDDRGDTRGAEVLLRWSRGAGHGVSPAEFIPVAEETGLILSLGAWVLQRACERLRRWDAEPRLRALGVSVNVSPRQFRHPDFVRRLERVLQDCGADPSRLTLELTEGVVVADVEDTRRKMQSLKDLGVRFSIDDFGTGYSSLAYLKSLPLDELKIDQSFVRDIVTDPNDAAIVETIIAMARHLGLEVVAEGVETPEALAFLRERGCRVFQGWLFGRPCSADELERWLLDDPGTVSSAAAGAGI